MTNYLYEAKKYLEVVSEVELDRAVVDAQCALAYAAMAIAADDVALSSRETANEVLLGAVAQIDAKVAVGNGGRTDAQLKSTFLRSKPTAGSQLSGAMTIVDPQSSGPSIHDLTERRL